MDEVITFTEGIPGYEASRRYVLVASMALTPFTLIQGIDRDAPSFVAIDPWRVEPCYAQTLAPSDLARLDATEDEALLWLALVAAGHGDGSATVNLRAPLVVNPRSMRGLQLIAADSAYRTDHPLHVE